ncbi:hypothetical protein R1flu_028775 [Riccia fluitans]|uniref:Elongin-A n=1 Tax=Riccia fluitans TaxID=41844 RepID=A0ABD1XMN0_9MARC
MPKPGRDLSERRTHKRDDLMPRKSVTNSGNKPPALEELCIRSAIDNLDHIKDVGHTDARLLKIILPHCTPEQLLKIEEYTKSRDLSPITNELWLGHYSRKFGEDNLKTVQERMKKTKKLFKWKALYQAKLREQDDVEKKCVERLRELYKESSEKKDSRKLQQIELMPPPGRKRTFGSMGGGGSSGRFGGGSSSRFTKPDVGSKGRLMKKARAEFVASNQAKKLSQVRKPPGARR